MTKEAIEKLVSEIESMYPYKISGNHDTFCTYNEAWSSCCDIFESKLLELIKESD